MEADLRNKEPKQHTCLHINYRRLIDNSKERLVRPAGHPHTLYCQQPYASVFCAARFLIIPFGQ